MIEGVSEDFGRIVLAGQLAGAVALMPPYVDDAAFAWLGFCYEQTCG